jgi:chorismate mutase
MNETFLLVNQAILPSVLPKVIEARDDVNKENMSVSEACKKENISRSAYYKYKDMVFLPGLQDSKRAILSLKVDDKEGVLTSILKTITTMKGNVLTIFQDTPIRSLAYITIKIDTKKMDQSVQSLVDALKILPSIRKVELISYE